MVYSRPTAETYVGPGGSLTIRVMYREGKPIAQIETARGVSTGWIEVTLPGWPEGWRVEDGPWGRRVRFLFNDKAKETAVVLPR